MKNLLTEKQNNWFNKRDIKIGKLYNLPDVFFIYDRPDYFLSKNELVVVDISDSKYNHILIEVVDYIDDNKEYDIIKNQFYKVNFVSSLSNKKKFNLYIHKDEMEKRNNIDKVFLYLIFYIPFITFNLIKRIIK